MSKGDHIYINCTGYTHHGIDCGDGTVIHYTGEKLKGIITRTTLSEFACGSEIYVKNYEHCDLSEIVVLRAEKRLGENEYNLFFNNCEHFATWCKIGKSESEQVNRASRVGTSAVGVGVSAAGYKTMKTVISTYAVSDEIASGLANGTLTRTGGIIFDKQKNLIVAWLRETKASSTPISKLLKISSMACVLNLGITMMGFAVINERLNQLEKGIQQVQDTLNKINEKIDLGYYANFRAALELAVTAIKTQTPETRRGMAINAITKLKEANVIYSKYTDEKIDQGSQVADEYLLALVLSYVTEARCYLELEEISLALDILQDGLEKLRPKLEKYIKILLTSNPAVYLEPQFKDQISLHRFTQVYQWFDSSLNEVDVFEFHRENLFNLRRDLGNESGYKWVQSLPQAIVARTEVKGSVWGNKEEMKQEALKRLPQTLEMIESLIETYYRLEAYQAEIKALSQLGIGFHEWKNLAPQEPQLAESELMYILPSGPVAL
ncbi:lecithin retinol acyltransferase family protein [Pantanalinema rosaneae CENA516]|uniref:lecithin retinol acyltransferase family protein n=1 Tax=Pantanalinema rosaneae TaxID=1620701 RepID=UPI003D6FB80D